MSMPIVEIARRKAGLDPSWSLIAEQWKVEDDQLICDVTFGYTGLAMSTISVTGADLKAARQETGNDD